MEKTVFNEITISGFRGISDLSLTDLSRINLIIGKNNVGKSSILEAMILLTGSGNPGLSYGLNFVRGFTKYDMLMWEILFYNLENKRDINIRGVLNDKRLRELIIKPNSSNFGSFDNNIDISANGNFDNKVNGLILSYKQNDCETEINIVNKSGEIHSEYKQNNKRDVDTIKSVYESSEIRNKNLSKRIDKFIINKQKNRFIDVLKLIDDKISDISVDSSGNINVEVGLSKLIPINFLGDGINKILVVLISILENPNGVVLIDEIENGLYYKSQNILWKSIIKLTKELNVQFFASTHSEDCINALQESYREFTDKTNNNDDIRVIRIDNIDNKLKAVNFNYNEIISTRESNWEIR